MTTYKKGLCSGCECVVPITHSTLALQEELDRGLELREIEMIYGDSINYLVINHESYGEHCDGSGQIPQDIIK